MKNPIGIQSFEKIRLGEYTYVDKTALIHQLVNTSNYYFLSRPRRFGKSLLISTLEAYFNGQQELFKGLEIEQLEKEWTKYPVLHLDLNTSKYDEKNSLINVLNDTLCQWENIYGTVPSEVNPELRFKGIIRRRPASVWSSSLKNTTNPCSKPLVTKSCKMNIATHSKPSTP